MSPWRRSRNDWLSFTASTAEDWISAYRRTPSFAVLAERSTSSRSTFWLASAQTEKASTAFAVVWLNRSLSWIGFTIVVPPVRLGAFERVDFFMTARG